MKEEKEFILMRINLENKFISSMENLQKRNRNEVFLKTLNERIN